MTTVNSRISVIAEDRMIVVDGVAFRCEFDPPEGLHALQWVPPQRGFRENSELVPNRSRTESFDDFSVMQPYVDLWQKAEQAWKDGRAKAKAMAEEIDKMAEELDKRTTAAQAAEKAAAAEQKPLLDALVALGSTDHEVIKAMEAKLAAEGALPADLVERRKAMRDKARAEKARLKAKGIVT